MSKRSTYLLEGSDCEHELGGFESDSLGEGTQEWVFLTELVLFSSDKLRKSLCFQWLAYVRANKGR